MHISESLLWLSLVELVLLVVIGGWALHWRGQWYNRCLMDEKISDNANRLNSELNVMREERDALISQKNIPVV